MPDSLVAELKAIVGDQHVLTDADLRASYETDWSRRYHGTARVVVRPGTVTEVSAVMRACNQAEAAVVPQGGNTGLVGGSVPRGGEVVLSLTRLNQISAMDSVSGEVTAGAGLTLTALQQHVRENGWGFGVDLASRDSATIGGMVATNAGGVRVIRYGGMRQQILGFEAVLANGEIVRRMPGLVKDNTGYDLGQLLAGSEGTLAVVTAVRLKLIPMASRRTVVLLALRDIASALEILRAVRLAFPNVEAAEVFFEEGLLLVVEHARISPPFDERAPCFLLIEVAGAHDEIDALADLLSGRDDFLDSKFANDAPGRARLWAYRERHTEAINAEGIPHKLDVSLPLSRLAEFESQVRQAIVSAVPVARPVLFGHAGDGNLHVNILGLEPDDERADDAVLRLVAKLDGSISAEHGIGIAKRPWLELTRSATDIAAMQAIKNALDPKGILNPGVILPSR